MIHNKLKPFPINQTDKVILSSFIFVAVAIRSYRRYLFSSPSLLNGTYYLAFDEVADV